MGFEHIPVLVDEVMTLLQCQPGQTYVDGTLGGGGHALEILKRTAPGGVLIGMDWDEEAIAESKRNLSAFGDRAKIFHQNFIQLPELLKSMKYDEVDGILLDLGLSSFQLEKKERGFSFQGDGALDMRMDQRTSLRAFDLVNQLPSEELAEILFRYGEERWARRIARGIVQERDRNPLETSHQLRMVIRRAIPRRMQSRKIDPATRTFQALRIRVNDELENLRKVLASGWKFLRKGGRMCVISFHSLEDRIVKETFRELEGRGTWSRESGAVIKVVTKKPIVPSEDEKKRNPRSRSAKLRCAERV